MCTNFRIDRGEAMLYTTHTWAAKYKNRHHFSKEALASLHSAHVVHQGSPLLVKYLLGYCICSWILYDQLQDLFHSTTYWLGACGIFKRFMDKYMEAEPYIPLPKENVNQPLVFDQLMMLWIIWVGGLSAAIFAFSGEFIAGHIPKDQKRLTPNLGQDNLIHPMASKPAMLAVDMEKKYGKRSQLNLEGTVEVE